MLTIYLIRHTEVAVGRAVCYGSSDVELTERFPEQLAHLRQQLTETPDLIVSSPLARCRQLADELATNETAVQIDDRLREYHFGDWELKPWNDIPRADIDSWMVDFVNLAPHNGESFQDVADRVGTFWQERILPDSGTPRTIYIVSHGGVIRALLCLVLGLPLQNAYRLNLDYGAVSKVLVRSGACTVQYINR